MKITKQLFEESIVRLQAQHEHDVKCSEAFSTILRNDFVSSYDNSLVIDQLVKLLKILTDDDHKDSWIDYFVYELDFGKKFTMGMVKNKGSDVDISTSSKLYDFLEKNLKS